VGRKYQISFIFEQENNYGEIKGHMRQLYDFNVPQKMLLIWTMNYNHDKKKIIWKSSTVYGKIIKVEQAIFLQ